MDSHSTAAPDAGPSASGSTSTRDSWNSKLGFILAASGSAIGLGNIVFFSSTAYQSGGGAFYLPYFFALFVLGIPVMILEFGLGTMTRRSLPEALYRVAGKKAEFVGWWSLASALFIAMYYQAILAWALGMMFGAFGGLFAPGATAQGYFFEFIGTYWPFLCVLAIWAANLTVLWRGTDTIEAAVRIFVPLMWLFMIGLIVRGVTLPGGFDGVLYLFTPDLSGIAEPAVWRNAFAQIFFSLSLGLGTMTAYASYLPKDADQVNNSLLVSFMNCGFEYIAGIAIFSLLFVYALNPVGGTLTLSFFAIPEGIGSLPAGARFFGALFFFLLVIAGITSSVSIVESPTSALIDKLGVSRAKALAIVGVPGVIGSLCFTLPQTLNGNPLGLSLLDMMDHWAFGYSLLIVGFFECVMVGWVLGVDTLRHAVNEHSKFHLGRWFNGLIKFVIPALLGTVILWNVFTEFDAGLYGPDLGSFNWLLVFIPLLWLGGTLGIATYLTSRRTYNARPAEAPPSSETPA